MKEVIQTLINEMSPATKSNLGKGLLVTWRGVATAFFVFCYIFLQEQKGRSERILMKLDSISKMQTWTKYELQAFSKYTATNKEEHKDLSNRLSVAEDKIAVIRGQLSGRRTINE